MTTPATSLLSPALRDDVLALARTLIVAGALHHGSKEPVALPFTPANLRRLGRAMEAMVAFDAHSKAVVIAQDAVQLQIAARAVEAEKILLRARREFQKSLLLAAASMVMCVLVLIGSLP